MTLSAFTLMGMVGLAGSIGALSRYLLGRFIAERSNTEIPLGTLLINVTGAFVIGLLFALASRKLITSSLQTTLATGFLGGYTTFSTMSWEGLQLARGGSTRLSVLYLGGSVLLGLIAATLGLALGWWL
ncbi:MAG: fluoride efflux transporter CrcB [Chloroflexi bacterium]|nr:fluoride efflux transporter CrcB [Chloroflexota bacterium]